MLKLNLMHTREKVLYNYQKQIYFAAASYI